MSRAHTRLLRAVNYSLREARDACYHAAYFDDFDDGCDGLMGEPLPSCPVCYRAWDGCGVPLEQCDICGFEACADCMRDGGDDLYPVVCAACNGEGDDA